MKIDIVIPWVDGADPALLKKRQLFANDEEISDIKTDQLNGQYRYRDSGLLRYLFRSIDRFAPWVHKVFLVTNDQWPNWLDYSNKKLVKVRHEDYIPERWLPTFSSNPILLNLHRISGLSDQFILFNDDTLINKPVNPEDFFVNENTVKDFGIYSVIPANDPFSHLLLNNTMVINEHFSKMSLFKQAPFKVLNFKYGTDLIRSLLALPWHAIPGFFNPHTPQPYLKKTFEEVWSLEGERLGATSAHRFREPSDLTDWVFRYWQIQSNEFEPQSRRFTQYYEQTLHQKIRNDLVKSIHSVICINDTPVSNKEDRVADCIIEALNTKFPDKSQFEI
ncbi:stealth conserved region 3 domain-containing protein [Lacticaseibacillus paracasei]|uniref:stealth conserved region 3 domain-containing protein n=1 Tax=Lacticaseibacillus paracasei TaxID=1597 RepID=UPI00145A6F3E|nr:stealth conserved region 3 domain-containing protein [Lacticaseibacillus paracasei]NMN62757.1 Stealth-like protein [Lacticaseibacillus casei]NMN66585.1 Stealth-like protein [Lacticaseibacillus casei CRF28]